MAYLAEAGDGQARRAVMRSSGPVSSTESRGYAARCDCEDCRRAGPLPPSQPSASRSLPAPLSSARPSDVGAAVVRPHPAVAETGGMPPQPARANSIVSESPLLSPELLSSPERPTPAPAPFASSARGTTAGLQQGAGSSPLPLPDARITELESEAVRGADDVEVGEEEAETVRSRFSAVAVGVTEMVEGDDSAAPGRLEAATESQARSGTTGV